MSDPAHASETPYASLDPNTILDAVDSAGFHTTGGLLALNSYENRVYQIELDERSREDFVVTKFYRPGRWSREQILEEHAFTFELAEDELPCVAPLRRDGESLFEHAGYLFAVFPRQGGHTPDIEVGDNLKVLARTLARMHAVGSRGRFATRDHIEVERMGTQSRDYLLEHAFIPEELEEAYESVTDHLLDLMQDTLDEVRTIRIHGDCHLGNLLWRDDTPHFVDFDDTVMGPPVQDLWMLLSGEPEEQRATLDELLSAYEAFYAFDYASLRCIATLRTLRIMHHAAWIARRWEDPAFPLAFPWFAEQRYWSEHTLTLREQQAALMEPPLL